MPAGRPSLYTPENVTLICEAVERTGSIRAAEGEAGISRATISRWVDEYPEFAAAIARAKQVGYEARAEEAVEKAKNAKDAGLGRLAFDADRWFLSKIDPARFGDKVDLTTDGKAIGSADPTAAAATVAGLLEEARRLKGG